MIMPVQRIPRYRMLLETMLKRTPDEHPDKGPLREAIESIKGAAADVDSHIAAHEGMLQVWKVQAALVPEPDLMVPGRTFVKEGPLLKIQRAGWLVGQKTRDYYFFLFSDVLVYGEKRDTKPPTFRYSIPSGVLR